MRVWKAVENFMNVDGRLATTLEVEAALQAGEAAKEEIARLKEEISHAHKNADIYDEEIKALKADADSRVQAVIDAVVSWNGGVFPHVLDQYRPKPKYVWEESADAYGNTILYVKGAAGTTLHQALRDNEIVWSFHLDYYPTADLAKAAVEKMLTDGGK